MTSEGLLIEFKNDFLNTTPEDFLSKNQSNKKTKNQIKGSHSFDLDLKITGKTFGGNAIIYPKNFYLEIVRFQPLQVQISPDLENLIDSDFLTTADKSFEISRVQPKLSFIALALSFLSLGFSWYISYNPKNNETKLSEHQLHSIINSINSIEKK
ncbi:hypothetical protein BST83_05850 [Polaribacter filamentus]|uniref:Uncharacterized protein n=1 Tax=Polaribacter filamentus TaxID=53483 RepID=A0A2S7KVT9_9FLAO|nr:hypothetical protein [Polaribacter filamentus]PQB06730.1 hypothetical protein BST83_05850 [Polaribacter filamentus]